MKNFLNLLLCIVVVKSFGQQLNYSDGPYVFVDDNKQYILYAEGNDEEFSPKIVQVDPPAKELMVYLNKPAVIDSFQVQLFTPKPTFSSYEEPSKLFAISDIEGNFEAFWRMLLAAKVINKQAEWIFEDGHLVLVGDFMDRGDQVTQCLWLVYELERQAELAGGKVHFVVGNHENMNLRGNDKYVRIKYLELARQKKMDHKNLWNENTVLGAWMRTKNCAVKIGNTLYVHGGISPELMEENLTLDQINSIAKNYYGNKYAKEIKEAYPIFSSSTGPLWYRGYFKNPIGQKQINRISSAFNIDHIVVGHTLQTKIKTYYRNKVLAIDTSHKKNLPKGKLNALFKMNNTFYVLHQSGEKEELF